MSSFLKIKAQHFNRMGFKIETFELKDINAVTH